MKLRQAISAVVFKDDNFFMVSGKDWPKNAWCFPQGGVNEEETHIGAVKRELKEELGTERFEVLSKSSIDHKYIFPEEIKKKKGFDGQYQTIWFVRLLCEFQELNPDMNELMQHSWFKQDEIIKNMMYPEQKETFSKVLEELKLLKQSKIF